MFRALGALWARVLAPAREREALEALSRRLEAVEAQIADCREAVEAEAERAARWADMQAQLRRFLGRLDAHAGKDKQAAANGGQDPKQLAAILRTKFPHAGG